ncbi:MAG: hypothetical protein WC528_05355 [Patescibacteria group bacterium]
MTLETLCLHQKHPNDCEHYYHPNLEREGEEACRKHHLCAYCKDGRCQNPRIGKYRGKLVLPKVQSPERALQ